MSTYEIDDDLVQGLIDNADLLPPRLLMGVMALKVQIPVPTPTKWGAIVRTTNGIYVHGHPGNHLAWMERTTNSADPGDWETTADIGRIVEVLFEGVDL